MQNALRPARETSEHDRRRVPRRPRSGGRPPPPRTRSARRRRHRCRGARDCSSNRSPARRSTRSGTTASPRRPPSPPSRTWSARSRCRWASPALSASTAAPSPARSTSPRDHRGRAPRVGQPRLLGHQQRRRRDRPRPQVRDDLRAGVPRRRRCRGRGARLVDPRQLRGAEGGRGGDDEPRRTPRRDAVRRRQLGVPAIPLRHQGRDGDEHGHHRHRGRLRRRRSRDGCLACRPSGNLCSDKKPAAINAVEGAAGASPPTFESRARSSKNACTPRPKRSRNSTHARTWSAPRRPRASGSTPTSPTSSPRCSSPPGRTRRRSSRARTPSRPPRCRTATSTSRSPSPPSKSAPSAAARNSLTQSEGLDILGVSGGGDPAGSNADALAECIAVGSLRANSPFSPRSPRGTSPAPTPNSVGNCMGVVVRPRFIGSEFVDPTLIMNVLSREIPRDYEIPEYNAYHEHITKG